MNNINKLDGLENIKSNKKGIFDYEIEAINPSIYNLKLIFNLENMMLKRILKLSLKSQGKKYDSNIEKTIENEKIPFAKTYKPYLNRFIIQPFNIVKDILEREDDFSLKTYEVENAYFIVNDKLKNWQVQIYLTGHYVDLKK